MRSPGKKKKKLFNVMDLDEDSCLFNVFWAETRSGVTYESFRDFITFYTTYLTKNYKMPFEPFHVSVNRPGQSVLFGCG